MISLSVPKHYNFKSLFQLKSMSRDKLFSKDLDDLYTHS